MSLREDFYTFLKAQIPTAGNRVYPMRLPQTVTLPAVTYQVISETDLLAHDGPVGLLTPNIQVDCWGSTPKAAWQMADELRQALDGFHGQMGDTRVDFAKVSAREEYEPETELFRVRVSVTMKRHEST